MVTSCRCCWYVEGGLCFNEKVQKVPTRKIPCIEPRPGKEFWEERLGNKVTEELLVRCQEVGGYESKRSAFLDLLPKDVEVVVMSEFKTRKG